MTLTIYGTMPHASGNVEISETAAKRARMTFNPSGNERVNRLKTLAAAFYSECEAVRANTTSAVAWDEAAVAMNHIQAGAMFAVSAATATVDVNVPDDPNSELVTSKA